MEHWARVTAELASLPSSHSWFLDSDGGREFDGRLARHQRRYLAISERTEAEALLRGLGRAPHAGSTRFGERTVARLLEVARLIDLTAARRAVVVGCGAFPAAALSFHDRTAAHITALEIDHAAAELARRVADRRASRRMQIHVQDGREHDYRDADTVYVVNQVTPKAEVLSRILATASSSVRVVVRVPGGPGRLLADSVALSPRAQWLVRGVGQPDLTFFSRHLVLARLERRPC